MIIILNTDKGYLGEYLKLELSRQSGIELDEDSDMGDLVEVLINCNDDICYYKDVTHGV
jgi:hypothetical protein